MSIWSRGWTKSSGTLEKTVQREQLLSTNLGTANAAGLMEPGGNAPEKLAMQFPYSLLSLESLNKCFAIIPFYISIPSQRNRREQGRGPGKYRRKVFNMPHTPVWCFHTHTLPSTHCWPLPAPLPLAHSSTCNSDPTNGSGDTSSNLKWGVTFTTSF